MYYSKLMYTIKTKDVSSILLFIIAVHPKKPTITASPANGILKLGNNFDLICQTESHGPQINFTFYKGNNSIPNNGPSNNTLTISSAGKTDDGKYSCQVEINGIKSVNSLTKIIRVIGKNVLFIPLIFS